MEREALAERHGTRRSRRHDDTKVFSFVNVLVFSWLHPGGLQMKRITLVFLFALLIGAIGRSQPAPVTRIALSDFFNPGVVFQDRNNDGAIDFVNARLALPEH